MRLISAAGMVALVLLLVLLIGDIMLDASGEKRITRLMHSLNFALLPLIIILGIAGAVRLSQILHII